MSDCGSCWSGERPAYFLRFKKAVIAGWERRLNTDVTHPIFGYTISYRRVLSVQARLLGRVLLGELQEYPAFKTR